MAAIEIAGIGHDHERRRKWLRPEIRRLVHDVDALAGLRHGYSEFLYGGIKP
ncbi:MAG: hypothetical protein P8Y95_06660 [Gammaproteobacteria bacterium]